MQKSYRNTSIRIGDRTETTRVQCSDNPIVIGCLDGFMRRVTNQIGRPISGEKKTWTRWWKQYYLKVKVLQAKSYQEWYKKSNSNVFVRIAGVNGLPKFVGPTDPASHIGEHNTLNTPLHFYLKLIQQVIVCLVNLL